MQPPIPPRSARRHSPLVALLSVVLGLATAAPAGAATSFPDPGPSGAQVTLDTVTPRPGDRIAISGTGFTPQSGTGSPWIAVKPNDQDLLWPYGGTDAIPGSPSDAPIWFSAAGGNFFGEIDVPTTVAPGPHHLRILSGAFADDEGSKTIPITYTVPITVTTRTTLGLTGPSGVFQSGTTFRPGAQLTLRGTDLDASANVTVKLGATTLTTTATTDADGAIVTTGAPATNRVTLPVGTVPGAYDLTISTGTVSETRQIRVLAAPTAALRTPAVRPGGLMAYALRGYVGVAGEPQKVAVVDGTDTTLQCVTVDADGDADGFVVLPTTLTPGSQVLRFAVGTRCVGAAGPVDDLPTAFSPLPYTLAATAPGIDGPTELHRSATTTVTATGFPAGAVLTPRLGDGAALPDVTAGLDGAVSVPLAIPADAALGERTLALTGTGTGALRTLTVVPAIPVVPPADTTPTTPAGPTPTVPTVPTVPTTPKAPGPVAPKLRSAKVKGTALRLTLGGTKGRRVAISVKSAKRIRVTARGRAKVVTFATATTTRTGTVSVKLTSAGRRALRRLKSVRVVVRLAPSGGKVVTATVRLRA